MAVALPRAYDAMAFFHLVSMVVLLVPAATELPGCCCCCFSSPSSGATLVSCDALPSASSESSKLPILTPPPPPPPLLLILSPVLVVLVAEAEEEGKTPCLLHWRSCLSSSWRVTLSAGSRKRGPPGSSRERGVQGQGDIRMRGLVVRWLLEGRREVHCEP